MKKMTVKIQRAILGVDCLLVYNKDRSIMYQCPPSEAKDVCRMMGKRKKIYASAQMEGTHLVIDEEVKAEDW